MIMDEQTKERIAFIEKTSRFPTGIGRIDRRECPIGALNPMGCALCLYGHMLECHYPHSCNECECDHYQREIEEQ